MQGLSQDTASLGLATQNEIGHISRSSGASPFYSTHEDDSTKPFRISKPIVNPSPAPNGFSFWGFLIKLVNLLNIHMELSVGDNIEAVCGHIFAKISELLAKIDELEARLKKSEKLNEDLKLKLDRPRADDTNSGMPGSKVIGGRRGGKDKKRKAEAEVGDESNKDQAEAGGESQDEDQSKPTRKKSAPRKKGGQPGHKGKCRPLVPPEKVDESILHVPESITCPECGREMDRTPEMDTIFQQIEVLQELAKTCEDRGAAYFCGDCGTVTRGEVPKPIRERSLFGPLLTTMVVMLRFVCNVSLRNIKQFLDKSLGVEVSLGFISKRIIKASECLKPAYDSLMEFIKTRKVLYIDETTHPDNGIRRYVWAFVTEKAAFFAINNRSQDLIREVLGPDYIGIICSDQYSVYIAYAKSNPNVKRQGCVAHLSREFEHCRQYLDPEISEYGERMLGLLAKLLEARDTYNADKTDENLEEFRRRCDEFNIEGERAPNKGAAANVAKRFHDGNSCYTTFVEHPEVDATNNRAERIIRKVVMLRNITQGTRSPAGRSSTERFLSVKATCELQGRSFSDFFRESYEAHLKGEPPPSILPID